MWGALMLKFKWERARQVDKALGLVQCYYRSAFDIVFFMIIMTFTDTNSHSKECQDKCQYSVTNASNVVSFLTS